MIYLILSFPHPPFSLPQRNKKLENKEKMEALNIIYMSILQEWKLEATLKLRLSRASDFVSKSIILPPHFSRVRRVMWKINALTILCLTFILCTITVRKCLTVWWVLLRHCKEVSLPEWSFCCLDAVGSVY